ncbi:hypothetical protein [Brevibacillus laterosporus]|uniref:Uncharacterized protein n=1 Tax=Brevibacillus laterosporus TaxID=1465 RepID=A0A0F7BZH2_BRELA|nr:hypothetical protein EX87_06825 [Brevibacillus laterosporus]
MFKKIIAPFLALSLAFSVSTPFQVQAKEKSVDVIDMTNYITEEHLDSIKGNEKTFDQLMKEYHLERADDQEVGGSTIKVDSPEELQIFLESIRSEEGEEFVKTDRKMMRAATDKETKVTREKEHTYFSLVNSTKVTLTANFTLKGDGSFRYISKVSAKIKAKEYGYGNEFINGDTDYDLLKGNTKAIVYGTGDIKQRITTDFGDIVYNYDPVKLQLEYEVY